MSCWNRVSGAEDRQETREDDSGEERGGKAKLASFHGGVSYISGVESCCQTVTEVASVPGEQPQLQTPSSGEVTNSA